MSLLEMVAAWKMRKRIHFVASKFALKFTIAFDSRWIPAVEELFNRNTVTVEGFNRDSRRKTVLKKTRTGQSTRRTPFKNWFDLIHWRSSSEKTEISRFLSD